MSRRFALAGALLVLPLVLLAAQGQERKLDTVLEKDIVYGKGGDGNLELDLARPKDGKGPFPAVVCIHGGGWKDGKRQHLDNVAELLAAHGFVAVTVTYRLAPAAKFPAQIEDVKAAVRWLRANAGKYHIDADHIGAFGFSAGGHLACLLGAADNSAGLEGGGGNPDKSSRVQAVVSYFGPTDFTSKTWTKDTEVTFFIPFLGDSFDNTPEIYKKASPIRYVSKDDPPFLFFHGTEDKLVKIEQSQKMMKALQAVGVPAKLVTMEGAGHGWVGPKMTETLDKTIAFFKDKLKK